MLPKVNEKNCTSYGRCVEECPKDAISIVDRTAGIDPHLCDNCGICIDACPESAILRRAAKKRTDIREEDSMPTAEAGHVDARYDSADACQSDSGSVDQLRRTPLRSSGSAECNRTIDKDSVFCLHCGIRVIRAFSNARNVAQCSP